MFGYLVGSHVPTTTNVPFDLLDVVRVEFLVPAAVQQNANLVNLQQIARRRLVHGAGQSVQLDDGRHGVLWESFIALFVYLLVFMRNWFVCIYSTENKIINTHAAGGFDSVAKHYLIIT